MHPFLHDIHYFMWRHQLIQMVQGFHHYHFFLFMGTSILDVVSCQGAY